MRIELPEIDINAIAEVIATEPPFSLEMMTKTDDGLESPLVVSLAAMEATGFMSPFDWKEEFRGQEETLSDLAVIANADLQLLRKIMTAHVRIDRMTFRHLDGLIASGYWAACYARLRELQGQMAG